MKDIKNLNFGWLFKANITEISENEIASIEGYEKIDLPHSNKILPFNYFDEKDYQFISCYKKTFRVLPSMLRSKKILRIEGIAHTSYIYIDNQFIIKHEGGYDEFTIEVDDYLTELRDYQLTIFVDATENKDIPPFGNVVDYLGYGGIYREISLEMYDNIHFNDIYIKSHNPLETDSLFIDLAVTGGDEFTIEIDGQKFEFKINKAEDTYIINLKDKVLWSIDNPKLYQAIFKLYDGYHITDETTVTFGIRDAKFTKDGFFLNGEQLKLSGLNRHQSYPYVGYAMPKRAQEEDAIILKERLGCNIVRTSHYMQSKHFLNKCDEIGLLVIEEMPGWQYIGGNEFKNNSYQNIKSMINRDKNHPSIIGWGVRVNESPDDHEFYMNTNKLAHRLDEMRQTFGVRNLTKSEFLEDVYTYNDFTQNGNGKILKDKNQVTDINNPYLVTETNGHMYPTKSYDQEIKRVEHALRHLRVINESRLMKGLSGAISWVMSDYNTHKDFGSGDRVCYHGVLDMFRNPKFAAYSYASQQDKYPIMEVLSDMNIGEYDALLLENVYVATNLDFIRLYKNDVCLGDYYPDKKKYPGLKHPFVVISDFIGNQLTTNEGISLKDATIVKELFRMVNKYGESMPFKYKLKMLMIAKKYHLSISQAMDLFFKYNSLWGTSNTKYIFEGYKDGQKVKEVIKEEVKTTHYEIKYSTLNLEVASTYDTVKVDIFKKDQNDNLLSYSFDNVNLKVSGGLTLLGPENINLLGGMISFWCKTNGLDNKGLVKIYIGNQEYSQELIIKMEK